MLLPNAPRARLRRVYLAAMKCMSFSVSFVLRCVFSRSCGDWRFYRVLGKFGERSLLGGSGLPAPANPHSSVFILGEGGEPRGREEVKGANPESPVTVQLD